MKNRIAATLLIPVFLFIFSCQSTDNAPVDEPPQEEQPVVEEPAAEETEPAAPQEEVPEVVVSDETGFEVSVELYEQTFNEMKLLIEKLNEIISDKNYEKWKLFLSEDYIKTYNDKAKLKQISEQSQILADNGIVLENLKDYFEWVVVPSRSKAALDDLVFLDDSHLTAYMLIKGRKTIL